MLVNVTRGRVVAENVRYADTFGKRLKGLLGRRRMAPDEALVIVPCRSVHTFGMRFAIDVLFLDQNGRVVHLVHRLRPCRATPVVRAAHCVVELAAGRLAETGCRPGDVMELPARPVS